MHDTESRIPQHIVNIQPVEGAATEGANEPPKERHNVSSAQMMVLFPNRVVVCDKEHVHTWVRNETHTWVRNETSDVPPRNLLNGCASWWECSDEPREPDMPSIPDVVEVTQQRAMLGMQESPPARLAGDLTVDQRRHVDIERAKQAVRKLCELPATSDAEDATVNLRRVLAAARVFAVWADVEPEVLGALTHAEPELHGFVMNAQQFVDKAKYALDRAALRPDEWQTAFEHISVIGTREGAWDYVAIASGALVAGPHTRPWDEAVEWFRCAWDVA